MTSPKHALTTEAGRTYPIPGYKQLFYSVTTALNVLSKPALVPWAAKQVAERALRAIKDGTLPPKKEAALKFLKAAPGEYTKVAQDRGTAVHKACELYGDNLYVPERFTEEVQSYVDAYIEFLDKEGFNIICQEMTVFSVLDDELGYAGTLDAIVEKDGKHYVMDIKTGGVYASASLQMAAYSHATHKIDDNDVISEQTIPIDGAFVLELKPNKYKIHYMDVSDKQYEMFLMAFKLNIWNTETCKGVIGEQFKAA